jgi:hypothetical protein
MANVCELLIKTVTKQRPKMLRGLDQKVRGWLRPSRLGVHGHNSPVDRQGLTHRVNYAEHGKPVIPSARTRFAARRVEGVAGRGCWRKRKPFCNGVDRDCAQATSSHAKAGRLPTGVSLRESKKNHFERRRSK